MIRTAQMVLNGPPASDSPLRWRNESVRLWRLLGGPDPLDSERYGLCVLSTH
jgi:hypothetical protein